MKRKRPTVHVTVTELRRRWGWVVGLTKRADVIVCNRGVPIAVLLSIRRYKQLIRAFESLEGARRQE